MEKILQDIKNNLDEIKALLKLVHQDRLQEIKRELLREGSIKLQIYNLCDGTRTAKDIAEEIQRSLGYVNSYLSILRREGLIRSVKRDGEIVHEQVF